MTPEESSLLISLGNQLVSHVIFLNLESTILWAMHAVITLAALVCLRRREVSTTSSKLLFSLLSLLLILSSYIVAVQWGVTIIEVQYALVKNSNLGLQQRLNIADNLSVRIRVAVIWLSNNTGLLFLIGDLVVLIRGYILWMHSKLWFIVPGFLFLASLALSITENIFESDVVVSNATAYAITGISAMVCSIAVNAVVTIMIAYQTYVHHQAIRETLGHIRFGTTTILLYLVEAGALYFILQVIDLVLSILTVQDFTPIYYAATAMDFLLYYVSITYPAIVILLVAYNRSLENDSSLHPDIDTHMSFVRRTRSLQGNQTFPSGRNSTSSQPNLVAWTVDANDESHRSGSEKPEGSVDGVEIGDDINKKAPDSIV